MKKLFLLVMICSATALPVQAQILVNLNFSGTNASYTGPGVIGSAGDYWNFLNSGPSGTDLLGINGTTDTGLQITWSGGNFPYVPGGGASLWANSPTPGITQGITNTNGITNYTLSGFTVGQNYTFDFLTSNDANGRVTTITLNGSSSSTLSSTMNPSDTSWINGNEYIQFTNVTPNATTGDFSFVLSNGSGGEGDLNGVQISGAAVPEPSTLAAISLGLVCVAFAMRYRRALTA